MILYLLEAGWVTFTRLIPSSARVSAMKAKMVTVNPAAAQRFTWGNVSTKVCREVHCETSTVLKLLDALDPKRFQEADYLKEPCKLSSMCPWKSLLTGP